MSKRETRDYKGAVGDSESRLDDFTDAAFAFAISLMVIGGASAPRDIESLFATLGDIPAFAVGFAIMAMFWHGHVRWRRLRGHDPAGLATFLTLLLIFLTMIYVQPLRAMASSIAIFFGGQGSAFRTGLAEMFVVYGTGFVSMSLTMAALFWEAGRIESPDRARSAELRGELIIWTILAGTGFVSVLLSLTPVGQFAAIVYSTLPLTIGLFSWRYDWTGGAEPEAAG